MKAQESGNLSPFRPRHYTTESALASMPVPQSFREGGNPCPDPAALSSRWSPCCPPAPGQAGSLLPAERIVRRNPVPLLSLQAIPNDVCSLKASRRGLSNGSGKAVRRFRSSGTVSGFFMFSAGFLPFFSARPVDNSPPIGHDFLRGGFPSPPVLPKGKTRSKGALSHASESQQSAVRIRP